MARDIIGGLLQFGIEAQRMSLHRMRRRYRDLLREEIAQTVSTTDEIDDEIRFLLSTLSM
jgi:RNA polymerase sigma-70 factor (ECF subfamily)